MSVSPLEHSAAPGGGRSPVCWSVLWSRGIGVRFGSGGLCCLAASTSPRRGPRDVTAGPARAREPLNL